MGYFGAYFGASTTTDPGEDDEVVVPIPAPVVYGDPTYVDHVLEALARLPEQFKRIVGG